MLSRPAPPRRVPQPKGQAGATVKDLLLGDVGSGLKIQVQAAGWAISAPLQCGCEAIRRQLWGMG